MREKIRARFQESIEVKRQTLEAQGARLEEIVGIMTAGLRRGGKIIIFGNGGSAADAQHIAAELVGRFKLERKGLAALALTVNTSTLTSLANDYGYEAVFSRQLEAVAGPEDVVIAISTSGESDNVIAGMEQAKKMGLKCVALTGGNGGRLAALADLAVVVPSGDTARIQECHITIGHILCELVEEELFPDAGGKGKKSGRA